MSKFLRDVEKGMTKPYETVNGEISSIDKLSRKVQNTRNKYNEEIENYISYKIQSLRRKYMQYEQEIGSLPKLKSINFDVADKDYYFNKDFESFETTFDFISDLRRSGRWSCITLSNRMALRTLAKDEKKLESFYEKHKPLSI